MSTQTSPSSLAKHNSFDLARRALALAPAADSAMVLEVFYETTVEIARELAAQQPLALMANLVACESVSDYGYMLTLLAPAQAAKSIIALLVTDDEHQQLFMPIERLEAERLIASGQGDRVKRRREGYWWARWEAKRVCEDFALQLLCLVLNADTDAEWKTETLVELGTSFMALAAYSTIYHTDGNIVDMIRRIDEPTASSVEEVLRSKDYGQLADDVFVVWEELTRSGEIFVARPASGESVEVSGRTLGDLLADIK
jgi:hypothetical protein